MNVISHAFLEQYETGKTNKKTKDFTCIYYFKLFFFINEFKDNLNIDLCNPFNYDGWTPFRNGDKMNLLDEWESKVNLKDFARFTLVWQNF